MVTLNDPNSYKNIDHIHTRIIKEFSDDPHNVVTPMELCDDIITKIRAENEFKAETKVLILCNIEFIKALKMLYNELDINMDNVYFVTVCPTKQDLIRQCGVTVFKYKSYKDFFEDNDLPKFDVVIGNPPYSENAGGNTGNKIWINFLKKIINEHPTSIIALLTPNNFLLPHHISHKLLKKCKITHICPNVKLKYFQDIDESIGYFILNSNNNNLKIQNIDNENLNINFGDLIPTCILSSTIISINNKVFTNREKIKIIKCGSNECDSGLYNMFSNWGIKKTNDKINDYGKSKLFISRFLKRSKKNRTLVSHFDKLGSYNIQDGIFFLTDNSSLEWILSESKLFKFVCGLYAKSQYCNPSFLKNIPEIDNIILTDAELYQHFNLTQEEIGYIENNV